MEQRRKGGETNIFKMGGKLGQGVGALKRRGLETSCELCNNNELMEDSKWDRHTNYNAITLFIGTMS